MPGEEASEEKGIYFQFACNRWFNMMQDMLILKKTIFASTKVYYMNKKLQEWKSRISDQ